MTTQKRKAVFSHSHDNLSMVRRQLAGRRVLAVWGLFGLLALWLPGVVLAGTPTPVKPAAVPWTTSDLVIRSLAADGGPIILWFPDLLQAGPGAVVATAISGKPATPPAVSTVMPALQTQVAPQANPVRATLAATLEKRFAWTPPANSAPAEKTRWAATPRPGAFTPGPNIPPAVLTRHANPLAPFEPTIHAMQSGTPFVIPWNQTPVLPLPATPGLPPPKPSPTKASWNDNVPMVAALVVSPAYYASSIRFVDPATGRVTDGKDGVPPPLAPPAPLAVDIPIPGLTRYSSVSIHNPDAPAETHSYVAVVANPLDVATRKSDALSAYLDYQAQARSATLAPVGNSAPRASDPEQDEFQYLACPNCGLTQGPGQSPKDSPGHSQPETQSAPHPVSLSLGVSGQARAPLAAWMGSTENYLWSGATSVDAARQMAMNTFASPPQGLAGSGQVALPDVGHAMVKEMVDRIVTIPLGDRTLPVGITVPGAVPFLGGQVVGLKTSYDIYYTDKGYRDIRVHDALSAFQFAQDAPDRTMSDFGNPFALAAFNVARALALQPDAPGGAGQTAWRFDPGMSWAIGNAYGDGGLFGLNYGANFLDYVPPDQIADSSCSDTYCGPLGDGSSGFGGPDPLGGGSAFTVGDDFAPVAEAADGVAAEPRAETGLEAVPLNVPSSGASTGDEEVYLKAVIPPAPPDFTLAFQPDYPTVIGQDPTQRGVDVFGRASLNACTVIWHHVLREYYDYCPTPGNCEVRERRREWDTTDLEPDAMSSATVDSGLNPKSAEYITGELARIYPGTKIYQSQVRVYPSVWARVTEDELGIPSHWAFLAERVPYADPGQWDFHVAIVTTGTPHCAPLHWMDDFPAVLTVWLREQRLVK